MNLIQIKYLKKLIKNKSEQLNNFYPLTENALSKDDLIEGIKVVL